MSKRRRQASPQVVPERQCLDFEDWKALETATGGSLRADGSVYDPSIEPLPDHLWYALDQQVLIDTIIQMCDNLGRPVIDCQIDDPEIADLLKSLARAKKVPQPEKVNVAVVGNQGIGKSSTINALLNRDLVDASASSSACTAFATIIEHKEGAEDHTDVSDLKVTFLEIAEIRDFIEEHIRRYADVYTPTEFVHSDDVDEEPEEDPSASEIADGSTSEEDVSDSDFSDASDGPVANRKKQKKVSKAVQKSADTAEQFFRILFNAQSDDLKEAELQNWLNGPHLEDGRFLDHCVKVAGDHLAQIQTEEEGCFEYTDVKDSELQKMRDHATMLWPLVKAVTISTGSVLLRNGIRFMDLPGYGDLNQTRTAVVNEYRRKANFEMVIAKSDRYLSKTDEDRFLHRAIRHHEAKNVFLVLNKADSCLETPQHQVIRMLKDEIEEPFVAIKQRLASLKSLKDETRTTVQRYRRYLIREAQMADGQRECDKIRRKMQRRGVQVFTVSSARYLDWLDPSPLEDPPFNPVGTGIPHLRSALLMLPAEASYKTLRYHVHETVTDIEDKVSRILMKFNNDIDVAGIRRYLLGYLPHLDCKLKDLSHDLPNGLLSEAWADAVKPKISNGLEQQMKSYPHEEVAYNTFWLMLRNNGIATHGVCPGKNLNDELMQTYKSTIKSWKHKATSKVDTVAESLNGPVDNTVASLMQRLQVASSDPELKRRVQQELEKLFRRIGQGQTILTDQLQAAVNDNYRRFTTEDDIKCPVAVELKTAYARINIIRMDERPKHRRGIYKQQKAEMIHTLTKSNNGQKPIVDAISVQVKKRQCELWESVSKAFIATVLGHFEEFAQALAELLEDETYMLEEHRLIRERLGRELVGFSSSLALVKGQFSGSKVQRAAKKVRTMQIKEEVLD